MIRLKDLVSETAGPVDLAKLVYHKVLIKNIFSESNICYSPAYLQVAVIPLEIRKTYLEKYQRVLNKISSMENFSNTNLVQSRFKDTLANSLHNELMTAYNMIQQPEPENAESLQREMVWWLSKWE